MKYVDRGVHESLNVNKHNYNFHEDKMRECIEFEILHRTIMENTVLPLEEDILNDLLTL